MTIEAYYISAGDDDDYPPACGVYFGETEAEAIAKWRDKNDGEEPEQVTRKPQFDCYAPGPVPVEAKFDDGWWFECSHCYHRVTQDGCYDCDEDEPHASICVGESVYCSEKCRQAHDEERQRMRELRSEAEAAVLARFPSATILRAFQGDGGCGCFRTHHENITVEFTVPGAAYKHRPPHYCHGCKKAWANQQDVEAVVAAKADTP